ncbi:unnamed protein product [Lota lota]
MVHPQLEAWNGEHNPERVDDAEGLADVFMSARKESRSIASSPDNFQPSRRKPSGAERGVGKEPFGPDDVERVAFPTIEPIVWRPPQGPGAAGGRNPILRQDPGEAAEAGAHVGPASTVIFFPA